MHERPHFRGIGGSSFHVDSVSVSFFHQSYTGGNSLFHSFVRAKRHGRHHHGAARPTGHGLRMIDHLFYAHRNGFRTAQTHSAHSITDQHDVYPCCINELCHWEIVGR